MQTFAKYSDVVENSADKKLLKFAFLICIIGLLCSLNLFGLIDPSDGYYPETAREMLERGDFFTPHLAFQPFYEKPIGVYWLILASYKIFGINEFAARIPSALSGIFCAAMVAKILRKLHLGRVGDLAAPILMSTPLFAIVAHLSLTDMPLTACLSVAILLTFYQLFAKSSKSSNVFLINLALGCAVLIKGPLALALYLPMCTFLLIESTFSSKERASLINEPNGRKDKLWRILRVFSNTLFGKLSPIVGLIIIAVICCPWYIFEIQHTNGEFFKEFFLRQHFARLNGTLNHQEPWYFYLLVYAAGTLPWTIFLFGLVAPIRRGLLTRQSMRARLIRLCIFWLITIIFLFSLSTAKLATYIVPVTVPTAILVALAMDYLVKLKLFRQIKATLIFSSTLMCVLLVLAVFKWSLWKDTADLSALGISLLLAPILITISAAYKSKKHQIYLSTTAMILSLTCTTAAFFHCYDEHRCRSLRRAYTMASNMHGSIANFARFLPGALFYTKRPITNLATAEDYQAFLRNSPPPHLVVVEKNVESLIRIWCPGLEEIADTGEYVLLQRQ